MLYLHIHQLNIMRREIHKSNLPYHLLDSFHKNQEQRSVEDVFVQLRNGMDTYDMKQIEDALRILHGMELSTAQRDLLDKVQEAYNDLEYETGAALLADFERIKD